MAQTIKLILYSVKDLAVSKKLFTTFLGVDPYVENPYYVGFKVENLEVGLTLGDKQKSPVVYTEVATIKTELQVLVNAGAQVLEEIKDVGGGMLVAAVKDTDGNILGLRQLPSNL